MISDRIDIQVCPDLKSLSRKGVEFFVDAARRSIDERRRFSVAISGGSTPGALYKLLGSVRYRDKIDWTNTHIFWSDERCVPSKHKDSNFRFASDAFLSKVPVPDKNVHRIRGENGPEQAAGEYENELQVYFRAKGLPVFDLILLGLGTDGHTASLFPGSVAINETVRLAVPVYREKPEHDRVTLTIPVLNNASHVIFLVSGISKSRIVDDVLAGKRSKEHHPAGQIRPMSGELTWLLDREAAVLL